MLLTRPSTPGQFDPVAGHHVGVGAPSELPFVGVMLGSLASWPSGRSVGVVEARDRFVIMGADGLAPSRSDRVIDGSDSYGIVDMEELAPGGVSLLFTLHLRP